MSIIDGLLLRMISRREDRNRRGARLKTNPPRESDVVAHYKVGPVSYYIYRGGLGLRLMFMEPDEPPLHRLKELRAGLEPPSNEAELYHLEKSRSGYMSLYPLILDDHIEEIAVEAPERSVAVIHKLVPGRWIEVDLKLSKEEVDSLAIQLARKAGRLVSISTPLAEGLTSEGHRVAITFSREVSRFGSSFVIRKYPSRPATIADMIASNILSPLMAAYIWILVEAQMFMMIIGNMGAGKTTLLQSIAGLIPPYYRVITIEDTPELRLVNPRWDALVTRPKYPGDMMEEVDLESLLKFALRRRAEYIIVGEVRGREARLLAQAAASGHGSLTTFHADSPEGALLRLQLDPINLPPLFLSVLSAIIHVRRIPVYNGKVKRRVVQIAEIDGDEVVAVFKWDPHTDAFSPSTPEEVVGASTKISEAWERLGVPHAHLEEELESRAEFLSSLRGATESEFYEAIARFYYERYGE